MDLHTKVGEVVDERVPACRAEAAVQNVTADGLAMAAVVVRVDDVPGRAQRLREAVIALAVLGDAVRNLNDGDRRGLPPPNGAW